MEFPCGTGGYGSSDTAAAWLTTMGQVQSLAWEFPHAIGIAKKKKKNSWQLKMNTLWRQLCIIKKKKKKSAASLNS